MQKNKIIIIAEAGVNHNGDIKLARELIAVAADAGANYVKFQTFDADKLVTNDAPTANYQKQNTQYLEQKSMLKSLELSYSSYDELINFAKQKNIGFLTTAFDLNSLYFVNKLKTDFFKIPSGEITNTPYLKVVGSFKKRIILSTGMSYLGEIETALDTLKKAGTSEKNIVLMHCTSEYPAPLDEVNLAVMKTLKQCFGVSVGYSDHTLGINIPIAAAAMGASIIEKHFTLNKNLEGPDHKASLSPEEFKNMVLSIREVEKAIGSPRKMVTKSEFDNRNVVRKSIVAKTFIRKGDVFSDDNLTTKRPGTGISPIYLEEIIGKKARRSFKEDDLIDI